jgi:hypothetical protein
MKVVLKTPKDVRNYIEDLLTRVPEDNAAAIAALLQVWLKAWSSDKIEDMESRLAVWEKSISEREAAFMEQTEEMMEGVRADLERRGGL